MADFMVEMAGAAVSAIVLDRGIPEAVKGRILRESCVLCTLGDYGYGSPDSGFADCSVWQQAVCVRHCSIV
ncbi:MAG: hypothetical protein ABUS47_09935, partial [Steroidobacter sp.]